VEYSSKLASCSSCASFDQDSASSLIMRGLIEFSSLQLCKHEDHGFIVSHQRCTSLICLVNVMSPPLSKGHPIVPVIDDGSMVQSRGGIHNSIMDAFNEHNGGAMFL
jgi:hypothetical protein